MGIAVGRSLQGSAGAILPLGFGLARQLFADAALMEAHGLEVPHSLTHHHGPSREVIDDRQGS